MSLICVDVVCVDCVVLLLCVVPVFVMVVRVCLCVDFVVLSTPLCVALFYLWCVCVLCC